MRLLRKWSIPVAALIALYFGGMLFADVVCRRASIFGFETEYATAKRVLGGKTTSDLKSCEVFVTKQGDSLYFHSNLVSEGFELPTKIATNKVRDLTLITANLYGSPEGSEFSPAETEKILEAHKKHVKYYFDQAMFDSTGEIHLDLGGAEKLYVVFEGAPPPKPLTRLNPIRGPPYVAEYHPSLFVKVTSSTAPEKLFTKLEHRPFKSREVRFVSLLPDSATETAIKASGVVRIREPLDVPSKETLQDLFRRNAGRVVVLLGHVEGDNFVATDPTGKNNLFTLPLTEVEQMAATARCDAVFLGCSSALAGTPVGVNKPFNPVDAVGRLDKALKADNYLEFVRTLSNEDMGLVFADTAFDRTTKRIEAEVYSREPGKTEPVVRDRNLAGRLILALGIAAASGSGSGGDDDRRNRGNKSGNVTPDGSGSNGPGTQPKNNPANQSTSQTTSQNDSHTTLYIILGVVLLILVGWVATRSRAG